MKLSDEARRLHERIGEDRKELLHPLYEAANTLRTLAHKLIHEASVNENGTDALGRSCETFRAFGIESSVNVMLVALRKVEDVLVAWLVEDGQPTPMPLMRELREQEENRNRNEQG